MPGNELSWWYALGMATTAIYLAIKLLGVNKKGVRRWRVMKDDQKVPVASKLMVTFLTVLVWPLFLVFLFTK